MFIVNFWSFACFLTILKKINNNIDIKLYKIMK